MKITKILVALSFLIAVSTANAGELTVTGSMEATYQSEVDSTTGNPLGMDRELKFAGSTELDNGITVSVMQDTSDSLAFGNSLITFGGVAGLVDISIGSDGGVVDAIDDVTPTAFEEANAVSGTYNDIGDDASKTGITLSAALPILGTFKTKYIPKADGNKPADKAASGDTNAAVGSMASYSLVTNMGDLPVLGSYLDGAKLTFKENALKEIAQKAISKKTGARGLRSILENILLKTMYDLPSQDNIEEVIVDAGAAKGQSQPILVHSKEDNKPKSNKTSAA